MFLLVAAGATFALLPPRAIVIPADAGTARPVRGVLHVHTDRSDGTGTPDTVAAAAARAGLSFVVFTDHGDASAEPSAPVYRHGVLCIDAVEISSDHGHVLALGLPRMPFVVGGAGRDVLEDIARFGGMSILAHPTSARPSLRWTGGDAGFDGVEWLNGDSEWRDEPALALARAAWTYWLRPAESLASLLDRPVEALGLWDRVSGIARRGRGCRRRRPRAHGASSGGGAVRRASGRTASQLRIELPDVLADPAGASPHAARRRPTRRRRWRRFDPAEWSRCSTPWPAPPRSTSRRRTRQGRRSRERSWA